MDQRGFDIRCEWGTEGVVRLAPDCDAIVIVDVLSFSTCVADAVERGATIYPYSFRDATAAAYAHRHDALLAGNRGDGTYTISPVSLLALPRGAQLVLPLPNGATLSIA